MFNPHLYIIRGLPGSGKSTLAKAMEAAGMGVHFETDMFFTDRSGVYTFDATKIQEAHAWCLGEVMDTLAQNKNAIVSNTFTRFWEMSDYISYCMSNGFTFTVITCEGNYVSTHGVPQEVITRMKARWEKYPYG